MRGFFAFGLHEGFAAELGAFAESLAVKRELSLLQPADYHLTLKFLSEFSSLDFLRCLQKTLMAQ